MAEMSIETLLQAAEYLERRERGRPCHDRRDRRDRVSQKTLGVPEFLASVM